MRGASSKTARSRDNRAGILNLMMILSIISLIFVALSARHAVAQQAGWVENEVNTTMCYWQNPRAGVIRDSVYLDGGYLWWEAGLADGSLSSPIADGNPLGLIYVLNFSIPFNTSQNISAILSTISKASGGGGAANNIGPQYVDGTMFANDYELFTYGGLVADTAAYQPPGAESVAAYQQYPSVAKQFSPGYILEELPPNMTRYVTYGAGVSIPSENLGFYFGGLRSSTWGDIVMGTSNGTENADIESLTLIALDMSVQTQEIWHNYTLPMTVPGRASAEIAWVPVSDQGVLVAVGGVIDPAYANIGKFANSSQIAASTAASPGFMSAVSVYDIALQRWYEQPTSGQIPPQLAEGCTVVASAEDSSSHNIYWYGGYDGLHISGADPNPYSDDVWILSVPSFMWMKFKTGNAGHARAGHRCVKPYPDQMFVIGGTAALTGSTPSCVNGSIIQIFNLTSGEWLESYDPKLWSNYIVPEMIVEMIGGSGTGSATQAAPSPTGFADPDLNTVFKQTYNASKITTWYPYEAAVITTTRPILPTPVSKSGTPTYLAPVLGVVLGLFFITLLLLGFLLYRRRKFLRLNNGTSSSETGTINNHFWVSNWLRSTPTDGKAPTVTTDASPMTPYEEEHPYTPEVGGTQVHEMMDTSKPSELQATGFVSLGKSNSRTRNGLTSSASAASQASHTSRASTVSHVSQGGSQARPPISTMQVALTELPALGSPPDAHIMSGISAFSETERGHLRGINETSVSTDGNYATPMEGMSSNLAERIVSPLTPPGSQGADYLGSRSASASAAGSGSVSPVRKSNFVKGLDEVEKK